MVHYQIGEKTGLQAAQKDRAGAAREKSILRLRAGQAGGILSPCVGTGRVSATKPMSSSHQPASCPECSTEYVRRVRRESFIQRLLSLFYIYPFRCQLCGYRFSLLQWKVKYVRVDEDRRTFQRMPVNFPSTFTSNNIESKGSVADISMAGCAFQTTATLEIGAILHISLQIVAGKPPIAVKAAVVRDVRQNRAGVEFLQIEKTERDRLRAFISLLLAEQRKSEE